MNISIQILPKDQILTIMPLMLEYSEGKEEEAVLRERFLEMSEQNYECAVMYQGDEMIGVAGLWFMTRHYSGKSCEPDHVYIKNGYRGKGLGKTFFDWIHAYAKEKGCDACELNTYVHNHPSHKFYYNHGYKILGYHFFKNL